VFRFAAIFIAIVVTLFAAELTQPVQNAFVIPFTESLAAISAWLLKAFDADVLSYGRVLQSAKNGFAISIEAGCNGVEAAIVLIAAMIAFAAPWKHRLAGIATGLITVQAMNLLRIVSLFYLGQWSMAVFEFAHLYLWQALIMLDVLIVWLLWLRWLPRLEAAPAA
jgi:exosortase H (IPTLxxWG-CTERM-specific)